ncbi:MAG: hypothetical protein HY644_09540 [Acidobacteria bacterium]|nr:hypothetical protein [Acidobacteriota bacterium]
MRTEKHLTLEDCLQLYLLLDEREEIRRHLGQCGDCLTAFQRMQREFREQAAELRRRVQEVPDEFWRRQRYQILSRVQQKARNQGWSLGPFDARIWVLVASIFVFSVFVIQWAPYQNAVVGMEELLSDVDFRDDRLLQEVSEAVNEDGTTPLRPLDLLVKIPDGSGKRADTERVDDIS